MTDYTLSCLSSGRTMPDRDDTIVLANPEAGEPAFLQAKYREARLRVGPACHGIYRFGDWLPIRRRLDGSSAPVTYKSTGLASALGLSNLHITFSGYWPERGVHMPTGTFKECEAYAVCARMPAGFPERLVVASAGNTARAFIHVCSQNRIPLLVVVPEANLTAVWSPNPPAPEVQLIAAGGGADYFDAIRIADEFAGRQGYAAEGGARNVARRDGMGTTVLSAATTIGRIPEYYFQAVGSGTGAIAAWEAAQRLEADGRFGPNRMRLMLSQNAPFLLLYDSWKLGSRELVKIDDETERRHTDEIYAKVLSNRRPPYAIKGGLYDALQATNGEMYAVSNEAAVEASGLFETYEGADISEEAAVATASLVAAVREQEVPRDAVIMLNITGGGLLRYKQEHAVYPVEPQRVVMPGEDI